MILKVFIFLSPQPQFIFDSPGPNLYIATPALKGAVSGLRQFLATGSPLKKMKNAFYFTSKAPFVLKICKFFSRLFGHVSKQLD